MKVNIFSVAPSDIEALRNKLTASQMTVIKEVDQDGWHGEFYYSHAPFPLPVSWAEPFRNYFPEGSFPGNLSYYAAYIFVRGQRCFVLSYGKTHFYIRGFADFEFGTDVAKRIADERDIKQTGSRRFQGRYIKSIRSYIANTTLDVESGESVDYLQGKIIPAKQEMFGKTGRFGGSVLLSVDLEVDDLGTFLSNLEAELATPATFKLPRTVKVDDEAEIARFDNLLVDDLLAPPGTADFTHNSYDLYGVDFVFSSQGTFVLRCPGHPDEQSDGLTISRLKDYIATHDLSRDDVLRIKVVRKEDDRGRRIQPLKETLDFIVDREQVVLSGGKWMRFNQDYLEFLDEYLSGIRIEIAEPEFARIALTEPEFNTSDLIREAGYSVADKDFSIFKTRSSTPVEAWDLKRGKCVYAVKFGTPQKLGYVCDQATAVLELLRNRAGVKEVPDFEQYCLWIGYRSQNELRSITDSGSIIFKQKLETWARKARMLGIEPVLKISHRVDAGACAPLREHV